MNSADALILALAGLATALAGYIKACTPKKSKRRSRRRDR
jgi:hypothetical protein